MLVKLYSLSNVVGYNSGVNSVNLLVGTSVGESRSLKVALLEDEPYQARLIQTLLEMSGHQCDHFMTGEAFIDGVSGGSHDLFILDWELPGISGIEVLKRIRSELHWKTPVLFTTTRDDKEDIVTALELGADDYMVKPVDHKEMLARINAMVRRYSPPLIDKQQLDFGEYAIDLRERKIEKYGEVVELTAKEFDLAVCFFKDIGHILTRESLLEQVWGINADITTRTVDTHVSRLRKKLGLIPENGWQLASIYHHGYRLTQDSEEH